VNVRQHGDEIDSDREETRAKFKQYFAESGMRGLLCVAFERRHGPGRHFEPRKQRSRFSSTVHIELLQVLASQATVALRNAQMYKEVPFISVLEPVLDESANLWRSKKRAGWP